MLRLDADNDQWIDTGLHVQAGQEVSLLSEGVIWLSREYDIRIAGNAALWHRIGDGRIAKSAGRTTSFRAERSGPLQLACRLAGQWLDDSGALDPDAPAMPMDGGLTVAAIVWEGAATEGLAHLAARDGTGLAAAEIGRIKASRPLPRGWEHLWRVGRTDIFCEAVDEDGGTALACDCTADSGIIKHPVDAPLDDAARLSWEWVVRSLPSPAPENTLITHDYMSIAVEFENGQDLTYFWSSSLPPETTFRCPIPGWEQRETHVVVRSGPDEIGRWVSDARSILADYRRAVGGEIPRRIVGVWIIALSPFQRRNGVASYRNIRLASSAGETVIGP
ncbi:hypothetical protein HNR47_002820 [Methylopila jiangsuensis]|uniref:DUF3047 domain-containing protein n=1 Tax=Methylopila jiangsuensis TaxID=586230 RepID=UPI0022F2E5CF|nr:DUF3047 domain-containing protein [Methylopila jiangsuensis]MDR6286799.1 hypothetical protein [Methylopila jiangsuensis]